MRNFELVLAYVVSGLVARWLGIKLSRYIAAHTDGGGWDAGTDFSFYPDLPEKLSKNYDGYFGTATANGRVRTLMWVLSAALAPFWWAFLLFDVCPVIVWFFADERERTWKSNRYLYDGSKETTHA
jgi:hypothetical protein